MSDTGNFLSRWSRRKREAAKAAPDVAEDASREASACPRESGDPGSDTLESSQGLTRGSPGNERTASPQSEADRNVPAAVNKERDKAGENEFDLSKLPSIESITAETDIRAFLAPGVPTSLRRAALRQAWAADPRIRDFIEVAEYQWDFNAPGNPGFDLSPPEGDTIKRMVAEIFGERQETEKLAPEQAAEGPTLTETEAAATSDDFEPVSHSKLNEPSAPAPRQDSNKEQDSNSATSDVQHEIVSELKTADAATQHKNVPQDSSLPPPRRGHGRAMPK